MSEERVPEEFFIGADSTPKETKHNIMLFFLMWLLVVLETTPLWSVLLLFLTVGHTHNEVDRFFSRVRVALRGRDYFTPEEMINVLRETLRGFEFDSCHLNQIWNWKAGRELRG